MRFEPVGDVDDDRRRLLLLVLDRVGGDEGMYEGVMRVDDPIDACEVGRGVVKR